MARNRMKKTEIEVEYATLKGVARLRHDTNESLSYRARVQLEGKYVLNNFSTHAEAMEYIRTSLL
jgi:hypothetical protein